MTVSQELVVIESTGELLSAIDVDHSTVVQIQGWLQGIEAAIPDMQSEAEFQQLEVWLTAAATRLKQLQQDTDDVQWARVAAWSRLGELIGEPEYTPPNPLGINQYTKEVELSSDNSTSTRDQFQTQRDYKARLLCRHREDWQRMRDEGMTNVTPSKVLKELQRIERNAALASTTLFPVATYRVLYVDPPWQYNDQLVEGYGAAESHYPTVKLEELKALADSEGRTVPDLAADNAVLFLWSTSPLLPDALALIDAWGFTYKSSFVWDKVKHNYGHYNSVRHELLLVATRGSCVPDARKLFDSVQVIERTEKHSEKPEEFRKIIDTLYPPRGEQVDRIELFRRGDAPEGWHVWGNEVAND